MISQIQRIEKLKRTFTFKQKNLAKNYVEIYMLAEIFASELLYIVHTYIHTYPR